VSGRLVLYDHPHSSNALKVRFLLRELGLSAERVHVPFAEPRPGAYVSMQPSGRIPLLIDGDVRIGESNAILRYLARRQQRDDLYPSQPAAAARVDWALDLWSQEVRPRLLPLEDAVLWDTGDPEAADGRLEDADPAAVERGATEAMTALRVWEAVLPGGDTTLGGERITIADCCVAPVLWRTARLPLDLSGLPRTARLRDALSAHPAFLAAEPAG
jgi:glutathione S-transferase